MPKCHERNAQTGKIATETSFPPSLTGKKPGVRIASATPLERGVSDVDVRTTTSRPYPSERSSHDGPELRCRGEEAPPRHQEDGAGELQVLRRRPARRTLPQGARDADHLTAGFS